MLPLRRSGLAAIGAAIVAHLLSAPCAFGHPGGLNAEGCHNDRKNGGYHCHRTSSSGAPAPRRQAGTGSGGGAFANCSAARAAGAAPVRVGDPGYGRHLDRDGDGIGCE
ncbi:excalibur calcium-binding domain-containing protein [Sphingomonas bisphenolicum]|uniref:excalibur calcium-binding domain-containing protein n=1 Tax=Sphingomonas bisphenolicum TaxID=296544 RepID=UPI0021C49C0D|nr:excalibur calcium-binding domain-containing protein [Sphingomonas bisphenolicum]